MHEEPRAGSNGCRRSGRSVRHGTSLSSFAKRAGDLSHQDCKWHIQRSICVIGLRVSIVAQNLKDQRSVVRHLYAERSQPRDSSLTFVLGKCSTRVQGDNGFKPSFFRRNRGKGCAYLEGQSRDDQVIKWLRFVAFTASTKRGSSHALTEERSRILSPTTAFSSGMVGPHILSRAVVTGTIGSPSTFAAFARATTLCLRSLTVRSRTPVNKPT